MTIESVIFYLLLLDSFIVNLMVWTNVGSWYNRNFRLFSRYFPLTKGWAFYYLLLVLWSGYLLFIFDQFNF